MALRKRRPPPGLALTPHPYRLDGFLLRLRPLLFPPKGGVIYRSRVPHAVPETRPLRIGPGESEADLLMRARYLHRDAQVFRSEDLVVEKFVNPDYPEEAREKGLEGPVVLLARVDVEGKVAGVEVMSSTGDRPLERAAAAAVWQCRFRPYELDGQVQEVYAVFRFRFQLY